MVCFFKVVIVLTTNSIGRASVKFCFVVTRKSILFKVACHLPSTVLLEISRLLNTGLDMESLSICVRLCEQGINPEALSAVIKELRKASETLKVTYIPYLQLYSRKKSIKTSHFAVCSQCVVKCLVFLLDK